MSSGCTLSPSTVAGSPGVVSAATLRPGMAAGFGLFPHAAESAPMAMVRMEVTKISGRRVIASSGRDVDRPGGIRAGAVDDRDRAGSLRGVGERAARRD